jgi:hypothetical protein
VLRGGGAEAVRHEAEGRPHPEDKGEPTEEVVGLGNLPTKH